MFNRSEIMKAAWAACRRANTFNEQFFYSPAKFAACLKAAWQEACLAAGVLSPVEVRKIERAASIRDQIEALKYKSFRYDTARMETQLRAELAALA